MGGPLESLQSLAGRPVPVAYAASRELFSGTTLAGLAGVARESGWRIRASEKITPPYRTPIAGTARGSRRSPSAASPPDPGTAGPA